MASTLKDESLDLRTFEIYYDFEDQEYARLPDSNTQSWGVKVRHPLDRIIQPLRLV